MPLARRSFEEEVVEDSEPEREALTLAEKSIIDISDDTPLPASNVSVIELSDSSCELPKEPLRATSRYFVDLGDYDSASELDMSLPQLRLTKYAHPDSSGAGPSKHKAAPSLALRTISTAPRATSNIGVKPLPKKPVVRNLVQRLTDEFGDSISQLLGCVSCDLKWTTRKSIPQKLTHMKSCAKKHGIKDDTMKAMVGKGIANAPVIQSKGKAKTSNVEDSGPKTFFDDVMLGSAPKKRAKRPEIVSTVKQLSETRDAIMSRARALVSYRNARDGQHGIDDDLSSNIAPSFTPRFGKSALAGRLGIKSRSMFDDDGEAPLESYPSPSSPSLYYKSLARPISTPQTEDDVSPDFEVPVIKTPPKKTKHITQNSPSPGVIYISSSSSSLRSPKITAVSSSPPPTPSLQRPTLSTFFNDPTFSSNEGGSYGLDGEIGQVVPYLYYDPAPPASPQRGLKPPSYRKTRSRSPGLAAPHRTRKAAEKLAPDENWAHDLKKRIIQDTALYLRILRYEPLPFSIFLTIAESRTEGMSSAKLKFHVRVFLDKQAINFYGDDAPKGKRRRR